MFNSRMKLLPETAPQMKAMAQEGTRFFDAWLAKSGTPYLQGNEPMLSDFWLFTVLHFGRTVKQPVNPDCKNVAAWMKRMEERASIKAVKA